jgi:V-type H+-transporting ATPase subunit C
MKVGPFETLLSLSDELGRADTYCEGVVRRAERAVADSYVASKQAEAAAKSKRAAPGSDEATPAAAGSYPPLALRVDNKTVAGYLREWAWDSEAWDYREPLPDLVKRLLSAAERTDAELRSYSSSYSEKRQALTTLERKRDGNLLVKGLEDVITPAALTNARAEFVTGFSEYLSTLVCIVPKSATSNGTPGEEAFLQSYESLAAGAVPYGPEHNRESVKGSPVVPGSARRIATDPDKDGYTLFLITALKKYEESLKQALKEKRVVVRDFTFNPAASGSGMRQIADLEVETSSSLNALREVSQRKFGEAFSLWMHVKAIRCFVEGVLKYGLPQRYVQSGGADAVSASTAAPFAGVLYTVTKGKHKVSLEAMQTAWRSISAASGSKPLTLADDDDEHTSSKKKGKDLGESTIGTRWLECLG